MTLTGKSPTPLMLKRIWGCWMLMPLILNG
jgi:hypothetical protein